MLISANQFRTWLRQSAATLRAGGSEASAVVYEEIADRLENESGAMREAYLAEKKGARAYIAFSSYNGSEVVDLLDRLDLVAVPRRWVE